MTCLYVYRMTTDSGLAPCAKDGLLSLACCKGGQMRGEKVIHTGLRHRVGTRRDADYLTEDVYILGTYEDKLLYLAKVTNAVTMEEYYSGMSKGRIDDIYSMKGGKLTRNNHLRHENVHTEEGRIKRDLAGQYVLLSDDYLYLGKDAVHVDILDKYNPHFQETKKYTGVTADKIIKECLKHQDRKQHSPTKPFPQKGGCR